MAVATELPLIATVSVGMALAFGAGFVALRLGLPPLVGYLVAGILAGPFTPGFVGDPDIASELAEIGVILLMFGVGTHFSVRDLWAMRKVAVPGAIGQIAVATAIGAALGLHWGWSLGGALVFGLALSVASTVVLLRALQDRGLLDSVNGRIAVGWLVVEDLAMVLALVLLPAFAQFLGGIESHAPGVSRDLWLTLAITFAKIGVFFALIYGLGLRVFPWLAGALQRAGSRELITVFIVVIAISLSYGAAVAFGVSFALGAFLAGVVVNESGLAKRFAPQVEVLEHVFAVMFFVSVGMVFNPAVLIERPMEVLAVLGVIVIGKSIAAAGIVRALGHGRDSAALIAVSLAQIGEFSFILAGLGTELSLLPAEGRDLILGGAMLSITLNPLLFKLAATIHPATGKPQPSAPQGHVLVVGYGRIGRVISKALAASGRPFAVVEQHPDRAAKLRARGWTVFEGDGGNAALCNRAGMTAAETVVIALPGSDDTQRVFELARGVNPEARLIVCCGSETEAAHYLKQGAREAPVAEQELGQRLARALLATS